MRGKRRRPRAANNRGDHACLEGRGTFPLRERGKPRTRFVCANRASPVRGAANNRGNAACLEVRRDRLFGWKQSEL